MSTTVSYPASNLTITYTFHNPRALPPVLLHFLLLRLAAIVGLFHVVHHQRLSHELRGRALALFVFLPTTPLAAILCRLFYCLRLVLTKPWPSDRRAFLVYLSSAVLGLRTWANAASLIEIVERGGLVSEIPANANDNTNSSSLLSGDAEDFQWLPCTCNERICCRFKNVNLYPPIIRLVPSLLYCAISFIVYLRRCSHDYVYMTKHLLQGTPPGSHEAELYTNALETISCFDQLNAMWALGGVIFAASAVVLKATGWHFMWSESEPGKTSERKTSDRKTSDRKTSDPPMLTYAEYALSIILYVAFTRSIWTRILLPWNPDNLWTHAGRIAFGTYAVASTYSWARKKFWMKEEAAGGAGVMFAWIWFVTQWPVTYAVVDAWELVSCITGERCPYPLFLWKDAWSDSLWIY